ncbi:MAG: Hpt domain-containing protein [Calditrichaceae bacterium]|jgi:HPt (histidine-containing phosphotransfer) domain-containing protein
MEEKLIDLDVALDRLGGDKEFLFELLDEMSEQMDSTLEQIEEAISSSDFEQIRSLAHGMKGASSNLGADRISAYFKELEQLGINQSIDGASDLIEKIKQTHSELLEYLKTV